jgi:hypothetical protein
VALTAALKDAAVAAARRERCRRYGFKELSFSQFAETYVKLYDQLEA